MKMPILGILAAFIMVSATLRGEDIETINHRVYKNATITRTEPDGIVVSIATGVIKIPFLELPEEYRTRFNYSRQAAETYIQQRHDAEARRYLEVKSPPPTQPREVLPQPQDGGRRSKNRASEGFIIEAMNGLGVETLEYKSPDELTEKERRVGQSLMLPESNISQRAAAVPPGGQLTVIIHGTTLYSTMTRNYTVIVVDNHGSEVLRKTGDDSIPTPSVKHWISAMIINLPKPIEAFVTVYVVNNTSGYREEYRISRS